MINGPSLLRTNGAGRYYEPGDNHQRPIIERNICPLGIPPTSIYDINGITGAGGLQGAANKIKAEFPNGVPKDLMIILYTHSRPGQLLVGYTPAGMPIDVDSSNIQQVMNILNPLLGEESVLLAIGCNNMGYLGGKKSNIGRDLFDKIKTATNGSVGGIMGGFTGLNKDPSKPPGFLVTPGGSLTIW